jgi:hypothetical protein
MPVKRAVLRQAVCVGDWLWNSIRYDIDTENTFPPTPLLLVLLDNINAAKNDGFIDRQLFYVCELDIRRAAREQ